MTSRGLREEGSIDFVIINITASQSRKGVKIVQNCVTSVINDL
jgi:hypothetical protein